MSVLVSRLDPASGPYRASLRLLEELAEQFAQSRAGGGERCVAATGTRYRAVGLPLGEVNGTDGCGVLRM